MTSFGDLGRWSECIFIVCGSDGTTVASFFFPNPGVNGRPAGQTISAVSRYKLVSGFYEFLTTQKSQRAIRFSMDDESGAGGGGLYLSHGVSSGS